MGKYIFELLESEQFHAGTKAKKDVTKILKKNNYIEIDLDPNMNKFEKLFFAPSLIRRKLNRVEKNSEFIFQYPLYSKRFSTLFLKELLKRDDIKKIVIIHDLESLRLNKENKESVKKEISIIDQFDEIISHNTSMTEWLVTNGISDKKIKNLEIFDYLNDQNLVNVNKKNNIVFAGNLSKSQFLEKIPKDICVNAFGINPSRNFPANVKYMGVFSPDELPKHLDGSFGLVWDGTSVEKCDGVMGEYLKYNNPHKASLYLSSGLPIIVWKQSAISDFVKKNKVGISIDSLSELSSILNKLTDNEYDNMKANSVLLSKRIREGYFTKKSLNIN